MEIFQKMVEDLIQAGSESIVGSIIICAVVMAGIIWWISRDDGI